MTTGRVASRATSNDFYDLDMMGDDEIRDYTPASAPVPRAGPARQARPRVGAQCLVG